MTRVHQVTKTAVVSDRKTYSGRQVRALIKEAAGEQVSLRLYAESKQREAEDEAKHAHRLLTQERMLPQAWQPSSGRVVPLKHWGAAELVTLLHALEVRHVVGIPDMDTFGKTRMLQGLPHDLYVLVLKEVTYRGLLPRGQDWTGVPSDHIGSTSDVKR